MGAWNHFETSGIKSLKNVLAANSIYIEISIYSVPFKLKKYHIFYYNILKIEIHQLLLFFIIFYY